VLNHIKPNRINQRVGESLTVIFLVVTACIVVSHCPVHGIMRQHPLFNSLLDTNRFMSGFIQKFVGDLKALSNRIFAFFVDTTKCMDFAIPLICFSAEREIEICSVLVIFLIAIAVDQCV
jgi:hypothetical protein